MRWPRLCPDAYYGTRQGKTRDQRAVRISRSDNSAGRRQADGTLLADALERANIAIGVGIVEQEPELHIPFR